MSVDEVPDTPVTIEAAMRRAVTRITDGVGKTNAAYRLKLQAAAAYDRAFARAYMAHEGPAHEKRYAAELGTVPERDTRDVADAAHRYAEATLRSLRDELDALRSIGASVRAAYSVAGVGER